MVARTLTALALSLVMLVTVAGPAPAQVPSEPEVVPTDNVVVQWDNVLLQAIRDTRTAPTIAARALAVVHTAMYDAWAAYDAHAVGTQLGDRLRRPAAEHTAANKVAAISAAAHRALSDLFPAQQPAFDAQLAALGLSPATPGTDPESPTGVGDRVAAAVIAFRHDDGANQLGGYADYTGYEPSNPPYDPANPNPEDIAHPERWSPLVVPAPTGGTTVQRFLTPHWYLVQPFALTSADQFRGAGPAPWGSLESELELAELIAMSATLDDRRKAIVQYWLDGPNSETPPGHWALLAQEVSRRDGNTLDDDVVLFFALGNAVLDATIVAWDAKRVYDSSRAITAIPVSFAGRRIPAWGGPGEGTRRIPAEQWRPYQPASFPTPPHPDYISGHSTISAAAAAVLRRFTGSDRFAASAVVTAGSSPIEPGITPRRDIRLAWPTFTSAANQAGLSRRLGGIHVRSSDLDGRRAGRQVGEQAWATVQTYVDGAAAAG